MRVFVKNMRGQNLMPCLPQRARVLLTENNAIIVGYRPFTIQLSSATGEAVQPVSLGIDTGAGSIGVAVTSSETVLACGTIKLRGDVTRRITRRKTFRRSRRNRKRRYRKPRFLNRARPKGWLPPSIQSRVDHTIRWIDTFAGLLPDPKIIVEVGKFDAARMKNPDIAGVGYQQGPAFTFWNTRYYVFARDDYTCQICGEKGGILMTHHIIHRRDGGSDMADNLASVHIPCHDDFHAGRDSHTFEKPKQYRETAFMNILRRQIYQRVPCHIVYGSDTKIARYLLGLEKSHANDAIAITGIRRVKSNPGPALLIRQFRKKKRSLHEATPRKGRKAPNRSQVRSIKNRKESRGVFLGDSVTAFGRRGYVTGFTGTSGLYVRAVDGGYITKPGKSYKQIGLKEITFAHHNNNWLWASVSIHPPPSLCSGRGLLGKTS